MRYLSILLIFFFVACKKDDSTAPVVLRSDYIYTFELEFTNLWVAETFPNDYPTTAAWGDFTGLTHNDSRNILLQENTSAVSSLSQYAQSGDNAALVQHISSLAAKNYNLINAKAPEALEESFSFEIQTTGDNPYLTLVSKIIPSPDWIIAVRNARLNDLALGGSISYFVTAYDVGVNSGKSYTSAGSSTSNVITIKEDYPLVNDFGQYEHIGILKITYKKGEKL